MNYRAKQFDEFDFEPAWPQPHPDVQERVQSILQGKKLTIVKSLLKKKSLAACVNNYDIHDMFCGIMEQQNKILTFLNRMNNVLFSITFKIHKLKILLAISFVSSEKNKFSQGFIFAQKRSL